MNLKQRALRGATWAVAGGNASQLLAFVMFVAISRVVGPEAFGTVAIAIAIVELCRPLASEAIVGNLVARGRFDDETFNAGFVLCLGLAVLTCSILALAAPLFAWMFHAPQLRTVLPQIALLLVFYAASRVHEAYLTLELRFDSLAVRSVTAALIGGGVGIAAAYSGLGVEALVLQQWAAALASVVLLWIACRWRPRFRFSRGAMGELVRSSATLAPAGVVSQLSIMIDALAVATFSGPVASGIYNLGKRMRLALVLGLSGALDRVSLPTFARVKTDAAQLARTLETALRLSTVVAFPVFLGVAAIAPELIAIFLGPEWADAALPMALLLVGGAVAMTTHYFDNVMLVMERRRWIAAIRLGMLLLLIGALMAVGRHGPAAAAAAVLGAGLVHNVAAYFAVSRITPAPLRTYVVSVIVPFGISLAMLLLLTLLREAAFISHMGSFARMASFIAMGVVFYAGMTWMIARPAARAVISAARTVLAT
jgi:O-antigen/teichoic acid export membrane protein